MKQIYHSWINSDQGKLWYEWDDNELGPATLPTGNTDKPTTNCIHEWKIYKGLLHDDEYCTKCNAIKPVQK